MSKVDNFIKSPRRALFKLALPILLAIAVQLLYNIVDTAFVGRLGAESIAALTFAFPVLFFVIAIESGIAIGMGSRISQLLGEKKRKSAENVAIHGIFISIITSLIIIIIFMPFLGNIFSLFGASEAVVGLSVGYMSIVLLGIVFMLPSYVMMQIFTSQGDTKTATIIQITAFLLNIFLDYIFIYSLGFGVKGAAIATSISFCFALLVSLYFMFTRSYIRLRRKSFSFSKDILKYIFSVGVPASMTMLFISLYIMALNRMMAHFGTDYVAAFGIAGRLESLSIMPIVALSIALMTLVGMFYGAKRYDLIRQIIWFSLKVCTGFTIIMGITLFTLPHLFFRIFTNDPNLISIGTGYIMIIVFEFPLMATGHQVSRALQGMGRGLPGLVINFVRIFAVGLPLACLFVFWYDLPYTYIPIAMVTGALASAIVALIWFERSMRSLNGSSR